MRDDGVMGSRPTGTVAFLFTDLVGSTRMWERHGDEMKPSLAAHDDIMRSMIQRLDPEDAGALGNDTGDLTFSTIGELATATAKAQRDAPTIAVCEI